MSSLRYFAAGRLSAFGAVARRRFSSRPPPPSMSTPSSKKTTILTLRDRYSNNEPLAMMTAHDYPSARFCQNASVDIVLVGDSLGMVALGYDSTIPVSMDEMLHHCRAVARGASVPFLVGDMPFGSYHVSDEQAIENAIKFVKHGNMEAVKVEGGGRVMADRVAKIVELGIPVVGHIGLTPQSFTALGGYRIQGKTAEKALSLYHDALALEKAGCFMLVLEAIPENLATFITKNLSIPTIGIGAGPQCSGQVLVQHDMLGSFDRFVPRFCKQYADLDGIITAAISSYVSEIKSRAFPESSKHTYPMALEEWSHFLSKVSKNE